MSPLPVLLGTFATCAGIPLDVMSAFWFAVDHAEGAPAVRFRERLLVFESRPIATPEATGHFWDAHMQPRQLVALIEALVEEGRLARQTATAMEDHVLRHVLADGRWR
jgi:hypothetical protein